ncbi:iron-containing alcohol dehydrogenase [Metabacillus iocasae]|uniref:Alcohol dehydrogenase class IV n=1 Tax=Priestia iocasae TaxID=2291674 RepID=A0ABS2QW35_9BACI|nr:iron-containing alcohol dehydrogenase [Metabacillus iocasae]MBM7702961.1 alcohol dehydrogenase class IV [Metabacillus iocasae]
MYKLYCRAYQAAFKVAFRLIGCPTPTLLEGENSLIKLPLLIKKESIQRVLIVTDQGITSIGLMDALLSDLQSEGISYSIYDKTVPNPTISNIEEAVAVFHEHGCEGIIAFGGGSPIDCAKAVGARIANPTKHLSSMKGQLKVKKKIPPLFAVPTTSGTGSEATIVAVISNSETHEKYAINDIVLVPRVAVLDPLVTVNLPPFLTATTGMDALTHAVEAYIGRSNTHETKAWSKDAVVLIFNNLYEAYLNGTNIEARANMQKASYLAGMAFTRVGVGYIHSIAHTLGGFYSTPHGLANAVIMPYVLEYYGKSVHQPLAELADLVNLTQESDSDAKKATAFIDAIKQLNTSMNIPAKLDGIVESDIPIMIERSLQEANPLYPVPKIFAQEDMTRLYGMIREG